MGVKKKIQGLDVQVGLASKASAHGPQQGNSEHAIPNSQLQGLHHFVMLKGQPMSKISLSPAWKVLQISIKLIWNW